VTQVNPQEPTAVRAARSARRAVGRIPATSTLLVILLLVGVVSGALWAPFDQSPLWDELAYGLPAFEAGRWWTPITGTFFVANPWGYIPLFISFWGMAYLEARRGSRIAVGYFAVGQLFAVLGAALAISLATAAPWDWSWAAREAAALDVGASGGAFAAIAGAVSLFVAPWRLRAWLVLIAFVTVTMVFWGSIDDLEHLLAVVLVLIVERPLRTRRSSVREQRLVIFVSTLFLGVLTIVTQVLPTDGPFGATQAVDGSWISTIFNVLMILIVANRLRRGRRWAWVVSIVVAALNLLAAVIIVVVVGILVGWEELTGGGDVQPVLAMSVMWAIHLWYLIAIRGAFRAKPRHPLGPKPQPSVDEVRDLVRAGGGGTLSWMTTWDGNEYLRTATGRRRLPARCGSGARTRRSTRARGGTRCIRHGIHRGRSARASLAGLPQCQRGQPQRNAGPVARPGGRRRLDRRPRGPRVHRQTVGSYPNRDEQRQVARRCASA
jgi:phosphatidylglycerol lysyltransferase